jgi:asparagine synthase (glutamine-hydrolysing)
MCGICGVLSLEQAEPDVTLSRRMAGTLAHRGPDGEGFYSDAAIALGHRRLSIIDLTTGDQPIFNEDRSVAIIFNGEIYNYRELRDDLLRKGHEFRTTGDTEVIVHLYEERGIECVRDLNGMFAFALWDSRRQRLLLARDPLGEKPLYYATVGGQFLFASEMKALLRSDSVPREIEPSALDDYLAYGYVPAPRTIYAAVRKLPSGHRLVVEGGRVEVSRYWHPWSGNRLDLDEPEAARELMDLLGDAVRLRLRSDVPVGAFLSGGIDSSLIVALAAREHPGLRTFSVRINELGFDESPYARLVAERFRTDHQQIDVDVPHLDELPMLARHFDEPFADASAIPTYYVTQAASRHLKVCLSGDGGDELFGGYSQYRRGWLERGLELLPSAALGSVARALPERLPGVGLLTRMSVDGAERHLAMVGLFSPEQRRALLRPRYRAAVDDRVWLLADAHARPDIGEVERRMLADQLSYLPEDILVKVDRTAMRNSLEVRVPFLDPRLVHFANALPLHLKIDGTRQKRLLRRLLVEVGLPELADRSKKGFGLPLKSWLRGRLNGEIERVLLGDDARVSALLEMDVVRRLVAESRQPGRDLTERAWALLWLEHWLRSTEPGSATREAASPVAAQAAG